MKKKFLKLPDFSSAAIKFGRAVKKVKDIKVTSLTLERKSSTNGFALSVYKGGVYCGPGWGFSRKDLEVKQLTELPAAVDAIDLACSVHDQGYSDNGYFSVADDKILIRDLRKIILSGSATFQQRTDAVVISAYFVVQSNVTIKINDKRRIYQSIHEAFVIGRLTMKQIIEQKIAELKQ